MTNRWGKKPLSQDPLHALNAICPYFTMFPLEFPLHILKRRAKRSRGVCDPFCGRGTTLYAARQRGIRAFGMDCSPVAVAISRAKLADFSPNPPLALARRILSSQSDVTLPEGNFWKRAFHENTLRDICRLRAGLLRIRDTDAAVILRATILGILHGPSTKIGSYLSNQMPRTFAPKPDYAVRFWRKRKLEAAEIDVVAAVERKLLRLARGQYSVYSGAWQDVHCGNAVQQVAYDSMPREVDTVITSPPYYGMRTYVQDQWLRHWFLGGPSHVDYARSGDLLSSSPTEFATSLGRTWANIARRVSGQLRLFVRFGAIPSRPIDTRGMLFDSLEASGVRWRVVSVRRANSAAAGKRQVVQMRTHGVAVDEIDVHAALTR